MPSTFALFGILGLALLLTNGLQYVGWTWTSARLERTIEQQRIRIEDPENGLVRQLTQCLTNGDTTKAGLDRISGEVKGLGDATAKRDEALAAAMAPAARAAAGAQKAATELLNRPREAMTIGTLEACTAGERAYRGEQGR
jgi:hypothetical protein